MSTMASASQLFRTIDGGDELWHWAIGCKVLEDAKADLATLDRMLRENPQANRFFTEAKYSELKKKDARIEGVLSSIPDVFDTPIASLAKNVGRLHNMHKASS